MKQQWTREVLKLLPATMREINTNETIARMNFHHKAMRHARGGQGWSNPVNSMAYDTLYRLRKRGVVVRDSNGVYRPKETL